VLKKRIIPTLLFNNLKLVKGINFRSWRTAGSIMQAIRIYNIREVDELILLDIAATNSKKKVDLELVEEIANECFMPLTFGGGINSIKDISELLKAGADKVCINTAACEDYDFIYKACKTFGNQAIVGSVDYKNEQNENIIYSNSGTKKTKLIFKDHLLELEKIGVGEVIITSIDKDGTLDGYDINTLKLATTMLKIPVIASGGAGSFEDMLNTIEKANVSALAAASIYHFTKHTPLDVKKYLNEKKIPVRI
tara:strand:+ start:9406 stop:10161 length:756 start_codon:yes stop_codon:yes gene_type:complete